MALRETIDRALQAIRDGCDIATWVNIALGDPKQRGVVANAVVAAFWQEIRLGHHAEMSLEEAERCRCIGMRRYAEDVAAGVADLQYAEGRHPADISVQGVLGEYAFIVTLFRLISRLDDTTPRGFLTETVFDAILEAEGWTVDIKTTIPFEQADQARPLMVHVSKSRNPPHAYALIEYVNYDPAMSLRTAITTPPRMRFNGFASSRTVFEGVGCHSLVYERAFGLAGGDHREISYMCVVQPERLTDRAGLWHEHAERGCLRYNKRDEDQRTHDNRLLQEPQALALDMARLHFYIEKKEARSGLPLKRGTRIALLLTNQWPRSAEI
ncbi:hypothetical protein pqer_cds_905 [Pandoravirus quercus]|uniref:Uncharacterized protein n=1 Tax=Pandoravirus quercus TaxID=2107709 RepID=A0A2U7UA56_9VIRU|nr:hypothetical protein pqer_cds_905 [Pandoravirus quercus]AVK75327.1 hypothetical protein pqer_cds_905 [Pandoravirus quercus]